MWSMQGNMFGGSNSIRMVRKASGRFLIDPFRTIWPVLQSVGFPPRSAHQMGVLGVGKAHRTGRVDLTTHQEPPSGQDDSLSS